MGFGPCGGGDGVRPGPKSTKEEKQAHIVSKYLMREFVGNEPTTGGVVEATVRQDVLQLTALLSHGP
jgi:hypothetical protein